MRRIALFAVVALLCVPVSATASAARPALVTVPLGAGAYVSDNVVYLGTIPIDSPAVGGRVVECGPELTCEWPLPQRRFYVTGAKGLTIYDVTIPVAPVPIGHLPLPHFQNEDVDVSDDGTRVLVSDDTTHEQLFVIDTTIPTAPLIEAVTTASEHTAMCADPACKWIYGSRGRIYDARQPGTVTRTSRTWGGGGHALNRDASGIVVSDSGQRLVLDPRTSPSQPQVLATGSPAGPDGYLQHNNVRPRADEWVSRAAGDDGGDMRPGEMLIGNSESNFTVTCGSSNGGLSTWDMRNFDRGRQMQQIEVFRPKTGTWLDGNPAVNVLGCSGHWFTERNELVAASWYEHGVRFFHVDPVTGKITQRGFFQPVVTSAGAAHWIDDNVVYNVDYARGIDVLLYLPEVPIPTEQEFQASWLANLGVVNPLAEADRFACRVAA